MTAIKGHFDGTAVVLDEPATLEVGQPVRVIVEPRSASSDELQRRADEALKDTRAAFAASGMTDDELAEWLEVETHRMRGVPYNHFSHDGQ
jgi:hypothetical protein